MYPVIGFLCDKCGFLMGGPICEPIVNNFAVIWEAMNFGKIPTECPYCGDSSEVEEREENSALAN
jgi:hypothetical protein